MGQPLSSAPSAPAVRGDLWWSGSNWDGRFVVPLDLAAQDEVCSTNAAEGVDVYGSEPAGPGDVAVAAAVLHRLASDAVQARAGRRAAGEQPARCRHGGGGVRQRSGRARPADGRCTDRVLRLRHRLRDRRRRRQAVPQAAPDPAAAGEGC
nr:hypothetical protein [Angustibacter aerolatus]